MSSFLTDARVLTRVGIVEMLAAQLYSQSFGATAMPWNSVDASVRALWREEARRVYDEALMNFGV
jgi:hypothetical protein